MMVANFYSSCMLVTPDMSFCVMHVSHSSRVVQSVTLVVTVTSVISVALVNLVRFTFPVGGAACPVRRWTWRWTSDKETLHWRPVDSAPVHQPGPTEAVFIPPTVPHGGTISRIKDIFVRQSVPNCVINIEVFLRDKIFFLENHIGRSSWLFYTVLL